MDGWYSVGLSRSSKIRRESLWLCIRGNNHLPYYNDFSFTIEMRTLQNEKIDTEYMGNYPHMHDECHAE